MSSTSQQVSDVKSVQHPSTKVGEMQNVHEQQRMQQQVPVQPGQQEWQQKPTPYQIPTQQPTTTTTTGQMGQSGFPSYVSGGISNVSQSVSTGTQSNVEINEPTIDLFNRFVAKDTHCLLGKTGIKISRVCLGTMNFGEISSMFGERPGQLSEAEAHKILDRFVELGGNCIDTADFFPWFGPDVGKTEKIIGNWLSKQDRDKIFLITKVRLPTDINNINSIGLSRSHLIQSVDDSLKRLQTNYIDLLCLNGWDPTVSFHDTVRNLNDLIRWNKINYIGVCDMKGWQLQKFVDASKRLDMHRCVCYMGEYNLLSRGCELEVLDVCKRERIGFIAYSPLKYGFLTNDSVQNMNEPVPNSRIESVTKAKPNNKLNLVAMAEPFEFIRQNPVYMNVLSTCDKLCRKYNVSVSQIAIQWLLQRGVVTSVCVGVEDVKELEQNMSCLIGEFVLSQEDMDLLDCVSSVHLHYPYRTQLSEVAGYRAIKPVADTQFEQLNVLTYALQLNAPRESRLNMSETSHESINLDMPEREFLRYPHVKAQQMGQSSASLTSSVLPEQQQSKIIQ